MLVSPLLLVSPLPPCRSPRCQTCRTARLPARRARPRSLRRPPRRQPPPRRCLQRTLLLPRRPPQCLLPSRLSRLRQVLGFRLRSSQMLCSSSALACCLDCCSAHCWRVSGCYAASWRPTKRPRRRCHPSVSSGSNPAPAAPQRAARCLKSASLRVSIRAKQRSSGAPFPTTIKLRSSIRATTMHDGIRLRASIEVLVTTLRLRPPSRTPSGRPRCL